MIWSAIGEVPHDPQLEKTRYNDTQQEEKVDLMVIN